MTGKATAKHMSVAVLALLAAIAAAAENDPAVRFRATGKADPIRIGNVSCKPAGAEGAAAVCFDLAWDHSWRVQWEEPAERTGGEATLKLENWDAAWVFVKFRRKDADPTAGWSHATLSTRAADHSVPAGAVLQVGLNDGAERGLGALVYRAAPGHGPNDFKGVCLRWLHAADGVDDPANVDIRVLALNTVYVPQCAFWAGDGGTELARGRFSAGYSEKPFRVESGQALTLGGVTPETLNNRETVEMEVVDDFRSEFPKRLPAGFPKGYAAFYCMRCEITQQQYVDFLNTLPYALQAAHTAVKPEAAAGASAMGEYRNGIRIVTPGVPGSIEPVVIDRGSFVAMGTRSKPGTPATYETTLPFVACNAIHSVDAAAFAAWAGLRPMTELEFEKACRGPLRPVPDEYAWGTDKIAMDGAYTLVSDGQPDETVTWSGNDGPDAVHGNAVTRHTMGEIKGPLRAGIFATPDSDRVRAGASYWGILDLSGNLLERTITVGNTAGRACGGRHGAGDAGSAPWPETALGMRGGWSLDFRHRGFWDDDKMLRISNRHSAAQWDLHKRKPRFLGLGFRCARTAPGR